MSRLENGQRLPEITAPVLDGAPMSLPDDVEGVWTALLFYRGHW